MPKYVLARGVIAHLYQRDHEAIDWRWIKGALYDMAIADRAKDANQKEPMKNEHA